MDYDFDELRNDLMNYYGSAMQYFPMAVMDLSDVENASEDRLLEMAKDAGFNLEDYFLD